jgi:hypothetical protein
MYCLGRLVNQPGFCPSSRQLQYVGRVRAQPTSQKAVILQAYTGRAGLCWFPGASRQELFWTSFLLIVTLSRLFRWCNSTEEEACSSLYAGYTGSIGPW